MKAIKKEICKFILLACAFLCVMLLGSAFEGLLSLVEVLGALSGTLCFCVFFCNLLLRESSSRGNLHVPHLRVARGGKAPGCKIA